MDGNLAMADIITYQTEDDTNDLIEHLTNACDIGILISNKSDYAGLLLAALRGDMYAYKTVLQDVYTHTARRVFENVIDSAYQYAVDEIQKLTSNIGAENNATLAFWTEVVENYEKRHRSQA